MSRKTAEVTPSQKQKRRLGKLMSNITNVKVNQQRHTAKAVGTKPGVCSLIVENTRAKNLSRATFVACTASREASRTNTPVNPRYIASEPSQRNERT